MNYITAQTSQIVQQGSEILPELTGQYIPLRLDTLKGSAWVWHKKGETELIV